MTDATIETLRAFVQRTPLSEKLLSKPPFRYLHDLVSEIIVNTGFGAGLYSGDELDSALVKDKEQKIAWLAKIIKLTELASGQQIKAKPAKIIAGLEPEETNAWLQVMGQCTGVSTSQHVQSLGGSPPAPAAAAANASVPAAAAPAPEPPTTAVAADPNPEPASSAPPAAAPTASKSSKSPAKGSSSSSKDAAKSSSSKDSGKKSSSTSSSRTAAAGAADGKLGSRTKSSETALARPTTSKTSPTKAVSSSSTAAATTASTGGARKGSAAPSKTSSSNISGRDKEKSRSKEKLGSQSALAAGSTPAPKAAAAAAATPPGQDDMVLSAPPPQAVVPATPGSGEILATTSTAQNPAAATPISEDPAAAAAATVVLAAPATMDAPAAATAPVEMTSEVTDQTPDLAAAMTEGLGSSSNLTRPVPVQRRERPTTARKAPPRARPAGDGTDSSGALGGALGGGGVPVVVGVPVVAATTAANGADADDEKDLFVVVEDGTEDDLANGNPGAPTSISPDGGSDGQQHGGLVRKLLESKREAAAALARPGSSLTMAANKRPASAAMGSGGGSGSGTDGAEAAHLQTRIQAVTRAAHPLGRTLDYLHEDMEAMAKELAGWRAESLKYRAMLAAERETTDAQVRPLLDRMSKLDAAITLEMETIAQSKARVLANEETMERYVAGLFAPPNGA
ncbi:microtubule-binding protein MIP-T3-domain-containing protein [Blastocladiella britannica]|nr:microtubule-binding protein MIP-T3-domain-containing protein [Blastocladiella britannica]